MDTYELMDSILGWFLLGIIVIGLIYVGIAAYNFLKKY